MKRETALPPAWPAASGEAALLVRRLDATCCPLGAPSQWPQTLRGTVDMLLPARVQIVLFWGPDFVAFYNDSYAPTIGLKHPAALGRPAAESWSELWDDLHPLLERVRCGGETVSARDRPFSINRRGELEEVYFDLSFSPVREADGSIGGVLCIVNETTERVRSRRLVVESEARLRDAAERTSLALGAGTVIGTWVWDIDGDRVLADDAFLEAFGIDPTDGRDGLPIGRFLESVHPEDLASLQQHIAEALADSVPFRAEYRVYTHEQRWRWIEASGHVERDAAGRPTRFPGVMVDIHSRKLAEEALREANRQLRLAQAAGGVGTFLIDLQTDALTVSPEFCRIFGVPVRPVLPAAEVETLRVSAAEPMSNTRSRLDGSAPLEVEYRIRRADDHALRWIARRAELVRDDAGRPVSMRGVVQDVTDTKQGEATLRESEGRFRALAQAVPNQVWTATADGGMDWFNDVTYSYSGQPPEALVGDGWARMVHPDDLESISAQWRQSLATRSPYATEFRLRRHDGAWRWHLVRAQPIGEAGARVRWIGTNTDINDQKEAQARLAQRAADSARDRDRLWQLSTDVMVVCDFAGTVMATNPAWEALLGWRPDELLGRQLMMFVHPDDAPATVAEIARLEQGHATIRFENRYRHKDGSLRTLSWNAVPDANFLHAVGRDVTALRESEARLRQSQKMEAIGQLTGGIAHDFNNMLQGITGSIEVMRRRVALGRTDDLDRYMNSASQSAHRAAALIQRLLAFSRRQTLDPRAVDVNALVASMEEMLGRTLGEQVRLSVQLDPSVGTALGDPGQLETALLNLAINARDAMPDGGSLTIATRTAVASEAAARQADGPAAGAYVAISVADTGVGMAPDVLAKVFDPFFTTKPIGQGTGLGLSMVYGFAQQSGGHVRVDSRVGEGTCVTLCLPSTAQPASALPAAVDDDSGPTLPQGRGELVLVVEDDPAVRLLVLDVLNDLGYRTLQAGDATEAMPLLQSAVPIDLLVSDVGLPGLNGRQLAELARQHRPDLRVLFMTGYAEHATTRAEFLGPGMDMIAKPFAIDDFAQRVEQIVRDLRVATTRRS